MSSGRFLRVVACDSGHGLRVDYRKVDSVAESVKILTTAVFDRKHVSMPLSYTPLMLSSGVQLMGAI